MNVIGLMFGFAVARGRPDASRIALVSGLPNSPVMGLVLASALANREQSQNAAPGQVNSGLFRPRRSLRQPPPAQAPLPVLSAAQQAAAAAAQQTAATAAAAAQRAAADQAAAALAARQAAADEAAVRQAAEAAAKQADADKTKP